jgi:ribosomal protein S18 acetylase RimI-like enzyme
VSFQTTDESRSNAVDVTVRRAEPADLASVARVHVAAFQGFFLAELGERFLTAYYRTVLDYSAGVFLVAEREGRVVGFIAGFLRPAEFYRLMSKRRMRFVVPALLGIARRPGLLIRIVRRAKRVMSGKASGTPRAANACELSSVAVDPHTGGKGVGGKLVHKFLEDAASIGAREVFLTTDAEGNEAVNRFYVKLGFQCVRTFVQDGDRSMNEYAMPVGSSLTATQ